MMNITNIIKSIKIKYLGINCHTSVILFHTVLLDCNGISSFHDNDFVIFSVEGIERWFNQHKLTEISFFSFFIVEDLEKFLSVSQCIVGSVI